MTYDVTNFFTREKKGFAQSSNCSQEFGNNSTQCQFVIEWSKVHWLTATVTQFIWM